MFKNAKIEIIKSILKVNSSVFYVWKNNVQIFTELIIMK